MFNVSDKVVCVDDSGYHQSHPDALPDPVKDQVYVISEILAHVEPGVMRVAIVGCENWNPDRTEWCGYRARRFRKLSEIQAANGAIRDFAEMCTKQQEEVLREIARLRSKS